MKRRVLYAELAYVYGIVALAVGTALMERADFGVSMVVAPAYLLYLKLSPRYPFFTFGMAEYLFQGFLLILMSVRLRKFRAADLFSFATAVIYGFALDGAMWIVSLLPGANPAARVAFFLLGMTGCALGVSLLFNSYLPPEVYELWVKKMSALHWIEIHRYKTAYDCVSCLIGVLLSFLFFGFGHFEGVKHGTILCAFANGTIIGFFSRRLKEKWEVLDGLPLRKFFEANY